MNDIEIRTLYRDLMEPETDPETTNRQRKLAAEAISALFQKVESLREENRRIAGEVVKINRMDGVRGLCYCGHTKALTSFERYSNGSNREAGFIAYTVGWGQEPDIKTSPRWCPLRHPYPGWEL